MNIEKFHAALNSNSNENPLLAALRKLTEVKSPTQVTQPRPLGAWTGWW